MHGGALEEGSFSFTFSVTAEHTVSLTVSVMGLPRGPPALPRLGSHRDLLGGWAPGSEPAT